MNVVIPLIEAYKVAHAQKSKEAAEAALYAIGESRLRLLAEEKLVRLHIDRFQKDQDLVFECYGLKGKLVTKILLESEEDFEAGTVFGQGGEPIQKTEIPLVVETSTTSEQTSEPSQSQ